MDSFQIPTHPEVFLRKDVLKICSKSTREHPCWSTISIKLLWNCCFFLLNIQHRFFSHVVDNVYRVNTDGSIWIFFTVIFPLITCATKINCISIIINYLICLNKIKNERKWKKNIMRKTQINPLSLISFSIFFYFCKTFSFTLKQKMIK